MPTCEHSVKEARVELSRVCEYCQHEMKVSTVYGMCSGFGKVFDDDRGEVLTWRFRFFLVNWKVYEEQFLSINFSMVGNAQPRQNLEKLIYDLS